MWTVFLFTPNGVELRSATFSHRDDADSMFDVWSDLFPEQNVRMCDEIGQLVKASA
jgi:hypothetical protein